MSRIAREPRVQSPHACRRRLVSSAVSCAIVAAGALGPAVSDARITKVEITTKESPTFGGYAWDGVGQ